MHDDNGKPIGIEALDSKTDIANSNNDEMVLSLNKDPSEMRFNDQLSNEDIIAYLNPKVMMNSETFLGDAVDTASNMNKVTNSEQSGSDEEKFDISTLPKLNTGPTLM